jgi:hypothetical protein
VLAGGRNRVDLQSDTESQQSSEDSSCDMDRLLAHHDDENRHIHNKLAENLPPPPQRTEQGE